MGAQISTNLSSGCSSREQQYLNIESKADLGRYIKYANKSTLMVINFTTTRCQPCKDAETPMRKLAEEIPDVKFARVDIDLLQDVVTEFHLDTGTMPTFLLCKKVDGGLDKGKGGNSVVPSATEGKSADSVGEGNRAAAGDPGGKSGTDVERANSAAVSGSKGESTTANAKEVQRKAPAPKGENATSTVKEGNSVSTKINSTKNGDDFTVIKEPSPKRRTVNYAGKKVFIDEIDRMEGSLEGHELRLKIEYYKNQPTTSSFKSTDDLYRYLEKSKPTQLMVINFTTEWCEPCKKAKDPFEKLSKFYEDVKFAKVDVDDLMNIAKALHVTMMPTFLLVKVKKQGDHLKVKKQGDHQEKKEAPERELEKKDGVQGDHKGEKKEPPVLNKRYEMVELGRLEGWNDKKWGELRKMIETHRYTTT